MCVPWLLRDFHITVQRYGMMVAFVSGGGLTNDNTISCSLWFILCCKSDIDINQSGALYSSIAAHT
jgi:hypothetical protein